MERLRKYYNTKKEANAARKERNDIMLHIWKMPKGTRHAGKYVVCSEIEFLNTY